MVRKLRTSVSPSPRIPVCGCGVWCQVTKSGTLASPEVPSTFPLFMRCGYFWSKLATHFQVVLRGVGEGKEPGLSHVLPLASSFSCFPQDVFMQSFPCH